MHCHDVGLEDPSTVAGAAFTSAGQADPKSKDHHCHDEVPTSYEEWIKAE